MTGTSGGVWNASGRPRARDIRTTPRSAGRTLNAGGLAIERGIGPTAGSTGKSIARLALLIVLAMLTVSENANGSGASADPLHESRPDWCRPGFQCIPTALAVENQVQKELLERDLVICESRCSSWGLCMGIGGATTLGVHDSQVSLTSGPSAGVLFGYRFGSFRRRPPP